MTLLAKRINLKTPGLAFLLIPFFFACDDPTELGLELEPGEQKVATSKVEFTLPASSIYIDSLRTDQFQLTVFGQYSDSIYGSIRAIAYNQYQVNRGPLPKDSLEYTSSHIILKVSDVRAQQEILNGETLEIYEAMDTLHNTAAYFADRHIEPVDPSKPIAIHTFDYVPQHDTINTYLKIRLNDDFGLWLFDRLEKVQQSSAYSDSLLNNRYYYPPLIFVPGSGNQALFSFDLQPDTVAIYINMENSEGVTSYFTFNFRNANFSEIIRDKSPGKLSDLTSDYAVSNVPSGLTYLDMISGVTTKLDLKPYLDFLETKQDLIINRAVLTLGVSEFPGPFVDEVPSLNFFFVRKDGRINGPAIIEDQQFTSAILTDNSYTSSTKTLLNMGYVPDSVQYQDNVTWFAQILADNSMRSDDFLTEELIVLSPRTIGLGQTSFIKSDIKLTVFYTTLSSE